MDEQYTIYVDSYPLTGHAMVRFYKGDCLITFFQIYLHEFENSGTVASKTFSMDEQYTIYVDSYPNPGTVLIRFYKGDKLVTFLAVSRKDFENSGIVASKTFTLEKTDDIG